MCVCVCVCVCVDFHWCVWPLALWSIVCGCVADLDPSFYRVDSSPECAVFWTLATSPCPVVCFV